MTDLIFATNNRHKVQEMQFAICKNLNIITLKDAGIERDIPEPFHTLEENAFEKCRVIHELTQRNCFSEDTGLEVEALDGAPGVLSARYAGEDANAENNINKLLSALKRNSNRKARFRTVIALILDGETHYFEGICNGYILDEKKGSLGFGYDPVLVPESSDRAFAEMDHEEKNLYSHRQKAATQLVLFLQQRFGI